MARRAALHTAALLALLVTSPVGALMARGAREADARRSLRAGNGTVAVRGRRLDTLALDPSVGGIVMANAAGAHMRVHLIFIGSVDADTRATLSDFVAGLGGSAWWAITSATYYNGAGNYVQALQFADAVSVPATGASVYTPAAFGTMLDARHAAGMPCTYFDIPVFILPPDATYSGQCGASGSCGYHSAYHHSTCAADTNGVNYAVIGSPTYCVNAGIGGCFPSDANMPNWSATSGGEGDAMASVVAHEVRARRCPSPSSALTRPRAQDDRHPSAPPRSAHRPLPSSRRSRRTQTSGTARSGGRR